MGLAGDRPSMTLSGLDVDEPVFVLCVEGSPLDYARGIPGRSDPAGSRTNDALVVITARDGDVSGTGGIR